MQKKVIVVICLLVLICFFKIIYTLLIDNNIYKEEKKEFVGIIVNIKKDKQKSTIDIKEKNVYRITLYQNINYELGDKVLIKGVFSNPPNTTVFNLFNYRKYLLSKNIKMISNNCDIRLIDKNNNILFKIKNKIIEHISKYKTNSYIKAFIIGDTTEIEDSIKDKYKNIGISHLFAISGMHVGIFLFVINTIFKNFKYKDIVMFIFLLFLIFITGFPSTLLRCFLFLLLSYLNKKFNIKIKDTVRLILVATILLLFNTYLIYNVGFLFSVTITFFIILSKKYFEDKKYIIKIFIVSLISFLSSIPIIACSFFKINLLSPIFNIIFVPFVTFIIFPFGLLTFMFPFLDDMYLLIIHLLEHLANIMDKIKLLSFVIAKPSLVLIVLYYLLLYLSLKINLKYIYFFLIILIFNMNAKFLILNPEITFLDVDQGDSSIIVLPKGKTIVIDTGGKYKSNYSIVKSKTIPYLNSKGINKIDLLILTHGDYDHIGEAKKLIENIKVNKILINKGNMNDLEKELINFKNIDVIDNSYKIDDYELMFLNNKIYDNENSNSIVTYVNIKNNNIIFMADADIQVEKNIINEYNLPKMDILKVGHHGSKTSSSFDFIKKINPTYSVISVGKNNRYGHPNKEVLKLLSNTNISRTDIDGSIKFVFKQNMVNKFVCKPYIIVER